MIQWIWGVECNGNAIAYISWYLSRLIFNSSGFCCCCCCTHFSLQMWIWHWQFIRFHFVRVSKCILNMTIYSLLVQYPLEWLFSQRELFSPKIDIYDKSKTRTKSNKRKTNKKHRFILKILLKCYVSQIWKRFNTHSYQFE